MDSIRIEGGDGRPIKTEYRGRGSPVLGVVVSGFGYTYRNPLLYYAANLLEEGGADVLLVDFRYYEDEGFLSLDEAGRDARFEADASAVAEALEGQASVRERLILVGKSLGTSVIRRCLRRSVLAKKSSLILLTPGSEWEAFIPELAAAGRPTLVVGSFQDRYYPVSNLAEARGKSHISCHELDRGDHSLETGDAVRDLEALGSVVARMKSFLSEARAPVGGAAFPVRGASAQGAAATSAQGLAVEVGAAEGSLPNIEIRTPRLELRTLSARDAPALYAYRSDPSVLRFQSFRPRMAADAERFIAENTVSRGEPGSWLQLGIFRDGRLAGDLGIHFLEPDGSQCEIGYTVAPADRGAGIGREAVRAVAEHLFRGLGKHRLIASVDPDNAVSIALLEGVGFRREARFRGNIRTEEGWADEVVYGLLAEDLGSKAGTGAGSRA